MNFYYLIIKIVFIMSMQFVYTVYVMYILRKVITITLECSYKKKTFFF